VKRGRKNRHRLRSGKQKKAARRQKKGPGEDPADDRTLLPGLRRQMQRRVQGRTETNGGGAHKIKTQKKEGMPKKSTRPLVKQCASGCTALALFTSRGRRGEKKKKKGDKFQKKSTVIVRSAGRGSQDEGAMARPLNHVLARKRGTEFGGKKGGLGTRGPRDLPRKVKLRRKGGLRRPED